MIFLQKELFYKKVDECSTKKKIVILDDPFGSVVLWKPLEKSFPEYQLIYLSFDNQFEKIQSVFNVLEDQKVVIICFGQGNHTFFHHFEQLSQSVSAFISIAPIIQTIHSRLPRFLKMVPNLLLGGKREGLFRKTIQVIPFKRQLLSSLHLLSPYIDHQLFNRYFGDLLSHSWQDLVVDQPLQWRTLSIPTLLIIGDRDPLISYKEDFKKSEQLLITQGGRLAFWEFYDLSILRIKKFFRDHQ